MHEFGVQAILQEGKPFRFEAMWIKDGSCERVIQDSWDPTRLASSIWGFNKKNRFSPR